MFRDAKQLSNYGTSELNGQRVAYGGRLYWQWSGKVSATVAIVFSKAKNVLMSKFPARKARPRSRYQMPALNGQNVRYKGTRFLVVEIEKDLPFIFVDKELADFAVFDMRDGAVIATLKTNRKGGYRVCLVSHVAMEFDAENLKEAVRIADREMNRYVKAVMS
jgi:hypothetical protein